MTATPFDFKTFDLRLFGLISILQHKLSSILGYICPVNYFIGLNTPLTFVIYQSVNELPAHWDSVANTIFLKREYFKILEHSCPSNMKCFFIGVFQNTELVGVALSQFLDLNKLESFGERDRCIKSFVRNFVFRNFSSHVLFLGNCMLTGENAYCFLNTIRTNEGIKTLVQARATIEQLLKEQGINLHLLTSKDFYDNATQTLKATRLGSTFMFSTQPNMTFDVAINWKTEQDYVNDLTKKYRDQYKRARKKIEEINKRKLSLEEIQENEEIIYDLYHHVAKNAPFNSFFLSKHHFSEMKKNWNEQFLFYGYFLNNKLVGFNTLIKNGDTIDTYFLGYDEAIQREKMLYLNMLYDMIGYSIKKGFRTIIFARTALEIKSSVGAKPREMFGFIEHKNRIINYFLPYIFDYLEPKTSWQERNPFK